MSVDADGLHRSRTIASHEHERTRQSIPWIIAVAVMFATFMEVLDTTVVNVSLPHIAGSLSATHRRSDVGADLVPRRQRHHPADDRMARQHVRPQAPADAVGGRLHRRVVPLRARADLGVADRLPHHAGRDRRRAAAAVAGRAARSVPAERARQGDGLLGSRHRRRADSRAGARRLADRQLQLALGLLHQHPGRHRVARHDAACSSSIRRTSGQESRGIDYWGIGMLAVGIGALQFVLDKGQEDDWFDSRFIVALAIVARGRAGRARDPRADGPTIPSSICASSRSAATRSACS